MPGALYTVPLRDDVRERAEKTLAERSAAAPEASREWGFYIIPDLKTWATNAEQQTPIEHFATFEEAKARFDALRSQPYNSEAKDLNTDGRPYAHLTLGMDSGRFCSTYLPKRKATARLIFFSLDMVPSAPAS